MSRSYRYPVNRDEKKKFGKKQANKKIRHYNEIIAEGGNYKKLYSSYNISDYKWDATGSKWEEKLSRK